MHSTLKILVVRFSSIGDIVLCTPVLRYLKLQKKAEIHFLTKSQFAQLLTCNSYVDKVWSLEKSLKSVAKELKEERFDYVIDLHNNLRTKRLKWSLKTKHKTVKKLTVKKALLTRFGIDNLPNRHVVDRYLDTIKFLEINDDGDGLDFFFPKNFEMPTYNMPFLALIIGGQHEGKRLPLDKWRQVCKQVSSATYIVGGLEDKAWGETLAQEYPHVENMAGKLSLFESAALVKFAQLVVSNDTGMMHIASAFGKDIISLWGQTTPKFGMYPYRAGSGSRILEPEGSRTLSKLGNKKTTKHAMHNLDVQKLIALIKDKL